MLPTRHRPQSDGESATTDRGVDTRSSYVRGEKAEFTPGAGPETGQNAFMVAYAALIPLCQRPEQLPARPHGRHAVDDKPSRGVKS